jgi:hypothetical protein
MNHLTTLSYKFSAHKIPHSLRADNLLFTVYYGGREGFTIAYDPDREIYRVNGCYDCTGLGWAVGEGLFLSHASAEERQTIMQAVGEANKVTDLEALYFVLKHRLPVTYERSTSAGSERLLVADTSILHRYHEAAYYTKYATHESARDALICIAQHPSTNDAHRYILLEALDQV